MPLISPVGLGLGDVFRIESFRGQPLGSLALDNTTPTIPFGGVSLIRANNTVPIQIDGFAPAADGSRVVVIATGSGQVDFSHDSGAAPVGSRLLLIAQSGKTSIVPGAFGFAEFQYDAGALHWRLIGHDQGFPITPAFNAADYTATGGATWTVQAGDVGLMSYYLRGRQLFLNLQITNSDVAVATAPVLQRTMPGGFTVAQSTIHPMRRQTGGVFSINGYVFVSNGGDNLQFIFSGDGGTNWPLDVGGTGFQCGNVIALVD